MIKRTYTYKATLSRVVDGDTVDLDVDLGFHMKANLRFRLLGINTPEINTLEGMAASHAIEQLLSNVELTIKTQKSDSFGRWLANIWCPYFEMSVNDYMITEGLAVPFMTPREQI